TVVEASRELLPIIVLGAPLRATHRNRLYNCAITIHRGEIVAITAKQNLATYREFQEHRWFAAADDCVHEHVRVGDRDAWISSRQIVPVPDVPGLNLFVEICEDMWVPIPPSAEAALAGATVVANLSGSPITVGRADERTLMVASASARGQVAYLYAAAGEGESTTDLAWDGQTLIYECGDLLGESERFPQGPRATIADIDLDRIVAERRRMNTFDDNRRAHAERLEDVTHGPAGPVLIAPTPAVPPPTVPAPNPSVLVQTVPAPSPNAPGPGRCAASSTASPSCPRTPPAWPRTATRRSRSRSRAWCAGCRRSGAANPAAPAPCSASPADWTLPTRCWCAPGRWTCWAATVPRSSPTRCRGLRPLSTPAPTPSCCPGPSAPTSRPSTSGPPPPRCSPTWAIPSAVARRSTTSPSR